MRDDLNVPSLIRAASNGDERAFDTLKNQYSLMSETGFAFFFRLSPTVSASLAQHTFDAAGELLRTTGVNGSFFRFLCELARKLLEESPPAEDETFVPLPEPPVQPIAPEEFEVLFLKSIKRLDESDIGEWLGIPVEVVHRTLGRFRRRPPS